MCLLAALREVSVARACSARSREGSSFTSAAKKGLQSFGEGVFSWLHSQSGVGDSTSTPSSILYHSISQYTTAYHSISQYSTVYHSIPQYTTVYYSIPQYSTVYHSISQYTTVYHSILQYTVYHSISQYITVYHSIPQYTIVNSPGMVMTRKGIRMILAGRFGFCAPTASL